MSIDIVQPGGLGETLASLLRSAVYQWDANRPRSKQRSIGASDIGHNCDRYLAYRATRTPENGQRQDSWPAMVGTATHETVLTDAFADDPRWITGSRLEIAPGVYGTGDLFDTLTGTVIDHKVLGNESLNKTKRHGAKPQYRMQVHMYGFGFERLGYDVHHVAIAAWPRSGFSTGLHVWTEPYDREVVEEGLQRWYRIADAAEGLKTNPALLSLLPTADGPCVWCPFHDPAKAATSPGTACAGHPKEARATA